MNPRAHRVRQVVRLEVARDLPPAARVLELHPRDGEMFFGCWGSFEGAAVDKDPERVASMSRTRPRWACYEGNPLRFLSSGMMPEPWDVIDIDPSGEPWPFVQAWATSARSFAPVTHLIIGDGYRHKRNASAPSRTLVPREDDAATRRQARRVVERAILDGRIPKIATQRCALCSAPALEWHHHDYARSSWLDVTALCKDCHAAIHSGQIDDPRLGRRWQERPHLHLTEEAYDGLVETRLAEWGASAGLVFEEVAHRSTPSLRCSHWVVTREGVE